jgi:hypothetical protein
MFRVREIRAASPTDPATTGGNMKRLVSVMAGSMVVCLTNGCESGEVRTLREDAVQLGLQAAALRDSLVESRRALRVANDEIRRAARGIRDVQSYMYLDCNQLRLAVARLPHPIESNP